MAGALPPYEQHGAMVAFWGLGGVFVVGEIGARFRSRVNRRGRPAERWSFGVVTAAVGGSLAAALVLARHHVATITVARWPLFVAGLTVMAAGIFVRQWAILSLGRSFTVDVRVHPDQTVVESGPYRWVRHPSCTGLILAFLGLGLALTDWASLATLAVLPTAALLLRIRAEERALLAALGSPYRRFAATRCRLFPGLW